MNKKAFTWSMIGKILFILICLVVILIIIGAVSGQSFNLLDKITSIFGFGG